MPKAPASAPGSDRAAVEPGEQQDRPRARSGPWPGRRTRPAPPGRCGSRGPRGSPRCPTAATPAAPRATLTCSRRPRRPCRRSCSRRIRSGLVPSACTSSSVSSCSAIAPASSGWPVGRSSISDRRACRARRRPRARRWRACRAASRRGRVDPDDDDARALVGRGQVAVEDLLDAERRDRDVRALLDLERELARGDLVDAAAGDDQPLAARERRARLRRSACACASVSSITR